MDPTEIAWYVERTDVILSELGRKFGNWELQSVLEKENARIRGVLEGLGNMGWYYYVREGLMEICSAKLSSKLAYTDNEVSKQSLQAALVNLPAFSAELAAQVDMLGYAGFKSTGKCQALIVLLEHLITSSDLTDKLIVFVDHVSMACPMARILSAHFHCVVAHICGVQAMDDATRRQNLQLFRGAVRILVATSSLEEARQDCKTK